MIYSGQIQSNSGGRDDTCLLCTETDSLHSENLIIGDRVVGIVRLCEKDSNALDGYGFTLAPKEKARAAG